MSTPTPQIWIRAELIAVGDAPVGPQLIIPADGLEFHGDDLVFHCQGEVVHVAEAGRLRSITWLGKGATPEAGRRKAQWPKHGVRWTDEEREELRGQLLAGDTWSAIAKAHGRSRTGVQQEALKQGWVTEGTYHVKAGIGEAAPRVGAQDAEAAAQGEPVAAAAVEPRPDHEQTVTAAAATAATAATGIPSQPPAGAAGDVPMPRAHAGSATVAPQGTPTEPLVEPTAGAVGQAPPSGAGAGSAPAPQAATGPTGVPAPRLAAGEYRVPDPTSAMARRHTGHIPAQRSRPEITARLPEDF